MVNVEIFSITFVGPLFLYPLVFIICSYLQAQKRRCDFSDSTLFSQKPYFPNNESRQCHLLNIIL